MTEQPRDWDREMAEIDKAIEKRGSEGDAAVVPAGRGSPPTPPTSVPARRQSVALTWFWTGLAVTLALALPLWPYEQGCGIRLAFFLGATAITLLAGFLGALAGWANRRAIAHVLSLLVLVWGMAIAAREVLPRTGYARETRTWLCPDAPAQPAPAQEATPPTAQPGTP